MAVTGASLSGIYDRLNNSSTRPMSASTFSDWSLEAGDRVTLTRDGQTYQGTVHNSSMSWKGKTPTVEINSTGNEKRDAVSKAEKKKYNRGGGGVRNDEKMYQYEVNQDHLLYEVYDKDGRLSKLQVTVNGLFHEVYDTNGRFSQLSNTVSGLRHEVYDTDGRFSLLTNTVDGLRHEVYDTNGRFSLLTNTVDGLRHEVYDTNGSFSLLSNTVDGLKHEVYDSDGTVSYLMNTARGFETRISKVVDANGTIKSASIATAINGSSSEVYISADHVKVTGNLMISALMSGDGSGNLIVANNIYAGLNGVNYIQGKTLRLVGASSSQGADVQTLAAGDIKDMIIKAYVSGNTLQLWKHGDSTTGDPTWTFNKAVSLSGGWTGTTYSVSATAGVINGTPPSTSVYLTVEGSPNPNSTIYAKVYKDNPSVAANNITSSKMVLQENAGSKTVILKMDETNLTKGSISTQATYNKGWEDSYGEIGLSWSSDPVLNPGQSRTIYPTGKATSSSGSASIITKGLSISARALRLRTPSAAITPTTSDQTILPGNDSGGNPYDGLAQVVVKGDSDLKASNIKDGVTIFGVTGSLKFTESFSSVSASSYSSPQYTDSEGHLRNRTKIGNTLSLNNSNKSIIFNTGNGGHYYISISVP